MSTPSQQQETPCTCARMRRAARRIKDFYDETLAPAGVTSAQYALLVGLSRMEGCATGELARAVGHEKSTLVRTLQPLLYASHIEDRSPKGSRSRSLYLTQKGKDAIDTATPLWRNAQKEIRSRLGENREQFMELLRIFDDL